MDYPKAYIYEPKYSVEMIAVVVVSIIILLSILFFSTMGYKDSIPNTHDAIKSNIYSIKAAILYVCIKQGSQLENLGLDLVGDRYFNIPINPTLIEASVDGFMAEKTVVDGKTIYKISLPMELQIKRITLDMTLSSAESAFVFIQDQEGDRVWEKNVKLLPGRYHKIVISSITIV